MVIFGRDLLCYIICGLRNFSSPQQFLSSLSDAGGRHLFGLDGQLLASLLVLDSPSTVLRFFGRLCHIGTGPALSIFEGESRQHVSYNLSACRRHSSCRPSFVDGSQPSLNTLPVPWQTLPASACDFRLHCVGDPGEDLFLDYLIELFTAGALSFIAMCTAALLRLLLYALRLEGGPCNADPLIRSARSGLRGASFAFLITACLLMVPAAGVSHDSFSIPADPAAAAYNRISQFDLDCQLSRRHTSDLLECVPGDPNLPIYQHDRPEPGVDPFEEMEEVPDAHSVVVRVFVYQRTDHYLCTWVTPGDRAAEVLRSVANVVLEDVEDFTIVGVQPQLPDDVLSTIVFPTWWKHTPFVPIVFDNSATWSRPFMSTVPRSCSFDDLLEAYGDALPSGMCFFLQNDSRPFGVNDRRDVGVGSLVRIRLAHEVLVDMPSVQEALDDLYWIRDVATAGMPCAPPATYHSLMIGPDSSYVSTDASELSFLGLHEVTAEAFDTVVDASSLIPCATRIDEAAFRGQPFESAWALMHNISHDPDSSGTGVFIDPRDFGLGIFFHVFLSRTIEPHDVLDILDFHVPGGFGVKVSVGASVASDETRPISNGCLITVWVEKLEADDAAPEEEPDDSMSAACSTISESSGVGHSWRRPFYISVKVFGVQVEPRIVRLSVIPEDDINSIIIELLSNVLDADGYRSLVPISPQPADDSIIFAMSAAWITSRRQFPVMIDASRAGGRSFICMLGAHFSKADIVHQFGTDWPVNAVIWLPGPRCWVDEHQAIRTGDGMLIVILRSADELGQLPPLEEASGKLLHPQDWARCLALQGLPDLSPITDCIALFGGCSGKKILPLPHNTGWSSVKQFVCQACDVYPDDVFVLTANRSLCEVVVRGQRVCLAAAVVEDPGPDNCVFFLDCRELGFDIAALVAPQAPLSLDDIFMLAQFERPSHFQLSVAGAELYTPETETISVGTGSVLIVTVAGRNYPFPPDAGAEAGDDKDDQRHDDDLHRYGDDDSLHPPPDDERARSRSPRRSSACGSSAPAGGQPIHSFSANTATDMWNPGFFDDAAFLQCRQEDTSVHQLCVGTTLNLSPRDLWQLRLSQVMQCMEDCFELTTVADDTKGCDQQNAPIVISLSKEIGPPTYNIDVESVPFPDCGPLRLLTEAWEDFALLACFGDTQLHEATIAGLSLCRDLSQPAYLASLVCQLYVDGSFKDECAAWGVVVVFQSFSTQETFFGGAFGDVLRDPTDPGWLGETHKDALQAEQAAICFAALWILQAYRGGFPAQSFQIHFDSMSAGWGANGAQSLPSSSGLSRFARGVLLATENYLQQTIRFCHVSAHAGHAWNELADTVAKICAGVVAADPTVRVPSPPLRVAQTCRKIDWDWAWTFWDRRIGNALPKINSDRMVWSMNDSPSTIQVDDLIPTQQHWAPKLGSTPTFSVKVLTANLQSLQGKHRLVQEQLVCKGVNIACFQETKCRRLPGYFRLLAILL